MPKKRVRYRPYNEKVKQQSYKWRNASPENHAKFLYYVRRSNARRIVEAKRFLSNRNPAVCVVKGCKATEAQLTFHHRLGDGAAHRKQLKTSSSPQMARWVLKNKKTARQRIECRCWIHHHIADKPFDYKHGYHHPHKLTHAQVQKVRVVKAGNKHNPRISILAKKWGVSRKTLYAIRNGIGWSKLPWPIKKVS